MRHSLLSVRAFSNRKHPAEPILHLFVEKKVRGTELMLRMDQTLHALANLPVAVLDQWKKDSNLPSTDSTCGIHPHRLRIRLPFHGLLEELEAHWRDDHQHSQYTLNVISNLLKLEVPLESEWGSVLGRAITHCFASEESASCSYLEEVFDVCSQIWTSQNEGLRREFTKELLSPLNYILMQSILTRNIVTESSKFEHLRVVLTALCRPFPDAPLGYQEHIKYFQDPRFIEILEESVHNTKDISFVLQLMTLYARNGKAAKLVSKLVDLVHVCHLATMEPRNLATYAECLEYHGKETLKMKMKPNLLERLDELMASDDMETRVAVCGMMLAYNDPRLESFISPDLPTPLVARTLDTLSSFPDWVEDWGGNLETLEAIPDDIRDVLVGRLASHWIHHAKRNETFEALAEYTKRHFHPESALAVAEVGKLNAAEWMESCDMELMLFNDNVNLAPIIQTLCLSGCQDPETWAVLRRSVPKYPTAELSSSLYLASLAGHLEWHGVAPIPNFWTFEKERYLPELEIALTHARFKFSRAHLPDLPNELTPSYIVEDAVYVSCFDYSTFNHPVTLKHRGSILLRSQIWEHHNMTVWEFSGLELRKKVQAQDWKYLAQIEKDFPKTESPAPLPMAAGAVDILPQEKNPDILENFRRLWPQVDSRFSSIQGIEPALPALSRAKTNFQDQILRRVKESKVEDAGEFVLDLLREKNDKIILELEKKYVLDGRAIAALKELRSWDVYLVTWAANRMRNIPPNIAPKDHADYMWGILRIEALNYPKQVTLKLFPECKSIVNEIGRYTDRVQYQTWKNFFREFRRPMVSHEFLLQKHLDIVSKRLQKIPLKDAPAMPSDPASETPSESQNAIPADAIPSGGVQASADVQVSGDAIPSGGVQVSVDLSLLHNHSLSDGSLQMLISFDENLRQRIIWQYLDTIAPADDPEKFLRNIVAQTRRMDTVIQKTGVKLDMNPSGKLLVPIDDINKVGEELFPGNRIKKNDILNQMRRLPKNTQEKILRRYEGSKNKVTGSKVGYFLGIIRNESKNASIAPVDDTEEEDIALLTAVGLSGQIVERVRKRPASVRRRVVWQYLDTMGVETDSPSVVNDASSGADKVTFREQKLAKVLSETLSSDRYLLQKGIHKILNASGKIEVPLSRLNPIIQDLFPDSTEKKHFIFDRIRRVPEVTQTKIVDRYLETKDQTRVHDKPKWFLGILNNEIKTAYDLKVSVIPAP